MKEHTHYCDQQGLCHGCGMPYAMAYPPESTKMLMLTLTDDFVREMHREVRVTTMMRGDEASALERFAALILGTVQDDEWELTLRTKRDRKLAGE